MSDFAQPRDRMVERQIAQRGVRDARVLGAMRSVPREAFVDPGDEARAHDDGPLPIGAGQTISQPYIVALMIEAARLTPDSRVLEVGAGSGYAAAVMSRIAARVLAIERHATLAAQAALRLRRLGYANVELRVGDGTLGWPEAAPFDAIVVSAGAPRVPEALRSQLAIGGRLVLPVGGQARRQQLVRVTRAGEDDFTQDDLGAVAFVPLIGEQGWTDQRQRP